MDLSDWEDVPSNGGSDYDAPIRSDRMAFSDYKAAKSGTEVISPRDSSSTTLVLVGKTGSGKSATGNSILGGKRFNSRMSLGSVTRVCELGQITRPDGRRIRVIDTPGMFDTALDSKSIAREIGKCMDLAGDGLHGILLVLSAKSKFTEEEFAAVDAFEKMFGSGVLNYVVVVFTNGDALEDDGDGTSLEEFLSQNGTPGALKDLLHRCGDRKILFDNKSKDKRKLEAQRRDLLEIVDTMITANSRIPYTTEIFELAKAQEEAREKKESMENRLSQLEQNFPQKINELRESYEKDKAEQEEELAKLRELAEESKRSAIAAEAKMEEQCKRAEEQRRHAESERARFEQERIKLEEERKRFEKEFKRREKEFEEKMKNSRCTIL